ncbi:MAG: leucine-rich repeat protein [Lachnospiraceae bacterium]|nr:leucine-rich repeat protein [Lachnospiraceae bacterium]
MKDAGKRLLNYIRGHWMGMGIALVAFVMVFTVVRGASGHGAGFDPWEIDTSFSTGYSEVPDRTGYDLSGEGEESEKVNHGSDHEEENEEAAPEMKEEETIQDHNDQQIVLPNGMTDDLRPSGTVDAAVNPDGNGTGSFLETDLNPPIGTENGNPSAGKEENIQKPSEGNGGGTAKPPEGNGGDNEKPSGGNEEKPELPEKPEEPKKEFYVFVDGEKMGFENEDSALSWIADHKGTNANGQYFEGIVKDENGNFVPSYGDKEHFDGTGDGETVWNYTGESSVFVVPEGTKALELAWISNNDKIKTIVVPKTVTNIITNYGSSFPALEKFVVSGDNPNYISVDGVLYERTEDGNVVLRMVPSAKKEIQSWPEGLAVIGENSFYHSGMEQVEFPETVISIESSAFNESGVGTMILPESLRAVGSMAFAYQSPKPGEEASVHQIIVKAKEPPEVSGTTFYWMDANLEGKKGEPVTKILVPDSAENEIYEDYLITWGMALVKRYGGEAALQILQTENGVQDSYEYYAENGITGYKRKGEAQPYFWADSFGSYKRDREGNTILIKATSSTWANAWFGDFSNTDIVSVLEGAFDGCSSMTAIRLPESLRTLPENVFATNKNLRVMISYAPAPPAEETGVEKSCSVFVRPGALAAYEAAWGGQVRKIVGTSETYATTSSGIVLDTKNTRLLDIPVSTEKFTFPSYVTSVYDGAAAGTALASITIPAKVTSVGDSAFSGCTNLTTVTWGTASSVPVSCFERCMKLKNFNISGSGGNMAAIGDRAFYGCNSLEVFSVPSAVAVVGGQVFDGREALALTLTFASAIPPKWDGTESLEGLTIYVPDSMESGDDIYMAYLAQWKDWLGERPGDVLKTKDGAESRLPEKEPETNPETNPETESEPESRTAANDNVLAEKETLATEDCLDKADPETEDISVNQEEGKGNNDY